MLVKGQANVRITLLHPLLADIACWWPFLLQYCLVSTACFLQVGCKQWHPLVPSGNDGALGHLAGEF